MHGKIIVLLILLFPVAGCAVRATDRPTVTGKVLDGKGDPIVNASVVVEDRGQAAVWFPERVKEFEDAPGEASKLPTGEAVSLEDGRFSVKGLGRWGLYFPPMDLFPYRGKAVATVSAPGYQPLTQTFTYEGDYDPWGIGRLSSHDLGDVRLKPTGRFP